MIGETVLYSEMKIIMEKSYLPLWLDFSNILLEETDFYDAMSNTLLNLMPDNFIFEISNLNLLNYIKNKKPNLKFVISKNANILFPMMPDIINNLN